MKRWTLTVLRKIILIILAVITIMFSMPNTSKADLAEDMNSAGGVLLEPVVSLFAAFGDTLLEAMEFAIVGELSGEFKDFSWMPKVTETSAYYGPEAGFSTEYESAEQIQEGSMGYRVPCIDYSPREIFAGVIPALDINFISPNHPDDSHSISASLQETIASWYVGLRNFSVVILLVVLVYVGIRMMLTSLAAEKAKYKQMFIDWLVAMCLIFFLHYIMSFTITMVETLTDALATNVQDVNVFVYATDEEKEAAESGSGQGTPEAQFSTNMTGLARFRLQSNTFIKKTMYLIIYLALVIYTLMFTITYLKRVLIMAFLTLIAPLVCMTYPIDKIGDGKAQAFNFWLKEYIFNALLQPFHLLLYAVFIGAAFDLSLKNPIYALVALGFILSAEKILRKMFGFEKAGTVDTLGAFAGGAIASQMINTIGKIKGPKKPEIEEKEQVNKIKPMKFNNGAYRSTGEEIINAENMQQLPQSGSGASAAAATAGSGASSMASDGAGNGGNGAPDISAAMPESGNSFFDDLSNAPLEEDRFQPMGSGERPNVGSPAAGLRQIANTAAYNVGGKLNRRTIAGIAGKTGKFVAKTALRGTMAVGAGAAGLAAGIATGDLGNAIKMGTAGLVAGNIAGKTGYAYAAKGLESAKKGINNNIVNPYKEGVLGTKEVKTQRDFRAFNSEANRRKVSEEFRKSDGSYLSKEELNEKMQQCFTLKQNGINNVDDQIEAVKLQGEKKAEYVQKLEDEMNATQNWINADEQAQIRSMSEAEREASRNNAQARLDEYTQLSQRETSSLSAQERTRYDELQNSHAVDAKTVRDIDKMNKAQADVSQYNNNKEEFEQRAAQRATTESIMAAKFKVETANMDMNDSLKHISSRFEQNGYSKKQAGLAAQKVYKDMNTLKGM